MFQALNDVDEPRRLGIRVELWDLDPRGLKAAESRLAPLMARDQLHVRRRNLFRIADDPPDDPLYDAVICSGFFDYLDPQQALQVGARLWRATAPKGWLQVFNFDGGHGSRGYMEWFGSWFLIYRDRAAMQSLAHALDAPGAVEGLAGDAIWRLRMDRP